jgi:sortase A
MWRHILQRTLWAVAAIGIATYCLSLAETYLYQLYMDWEFAQMATGRPVGLEYFVADLIQDPPPGLPLLQGKRPKTMSAAASGHTSFHVAGRPAGRLEIPSINLSAIFLEGVDDATLRRGIGHIPGTSFPGSNGNAGLSAHRDSFFRHLGKLHRDDWIRITTLEGTYEYIVESTQIVDPDEAIVLKDRGKPELTLVTCYPFYFVGPAPKRFIVHATLVAAGISER